MYDVTTSEKLLDFPGSPTIVGSVVRAIAWSGANNSRPDNSTISTVHIVNRDEPIDGIAVMVASAIKFTPPGVVRGCPSPAPRVGFLLPGELAQPL